MHSWSYNGRSFENITKHFRASPSQFLQVIDIVAFTFCCCIRCCWRMGGFFLFKWKRRYHWYSSITHLKFSTVWDYWGGMTLKATCGILDFAHTNSNSEFWPIAFYFGILKSNWQIWGLCLGSFQYLQYMFSCEETGRSNKPFHPVSLINLFIH